MGYYYTHLSINDRRRLNENMNGRLRRYLPRETNITNITQEELDQLAIKMNRCPQKCLNYKTPQELLIQQHKNDCRIWS
jgi:IS30 family transposase